MNNMKKSLWIVLAVVAVLAVWGYSVYNGLVEKEEAVHGAWSNVETQYQRRSDLIPNLVNTVKGYAAHEQQTLAAVVDARSKATSMNVDADDLTPPFSGQSGGGNTLVRAETLFRGGRQRCAGARSRLLIRQTTNPDSI